MMTSPRMGSPSCFSRLLEATVISLIILRASVSLLTWSCSTWPDLKSFTPSGVTPLGCCRSGCCA
ncbi:hypothetical protein [Rock bream iridovirus]|uniref:Uncharacterized protein n=2 Tax=Infectious spleen and kidney necrosis virus TaxID=180170 RepID=M1SWX2_ISKNV|nr:ORF120R [Orange-spotted grouper iridovirus]AGG37997.1 hypothetical protein [Rock bream iridovirus]